MSLSSPISNARAERGLAIGVVLLLALGCRGPLDPDGAPTEEFPLSPEMRQLAADTADPDYLAVLRGMHRNDLREEIYRVEIPDNPVEFAARYAESNPLDSDPALRDAYERRRRICDAFVALVRAEAARRELGDLLPEDLTIAAPGAVDLKNGTETPELVVETTYPADGYASEWPRWRGPSGQGNFSDDDVPTEWDVPSGRGLLWKTPIPGAGNSSPVVWGDHVFLTTAFDRGNRRSLVGIDRASGSIRFVRDAPAVPPEGRVIAKSGYASATPAVDGERVYAFFGNTGIVAFNFAGDVLWRAPLAPFDAMHGTGASPVLWRDLVVLLQEQSGKPSVAIAVDRATGEERWSVERGRALGWCTPLAVRVGGVDQLIYGTKRALVGIDPSSGEELWRCDGATPEVIPTPVAGHGLVFSASGRSGPTLAVRPTGRGNVTASHLAWSTRRGSPHVPSPILVGELLYMANDTGILTCLEARSGRTVYQQRLRGRFSASPIANGTQIYFTNEDGRTFVVRAGRDFEILAENDAGERVLASMAVHRGEFLQRGAEHLFAYGRAVAAARSSDGGDGRSPGSRADDSPFGLAALEAGPEGADFEAFLDLASRESERFRRRFLADSGTRVLETTVKFKESAALWLADRRGVDRFLLDAPELERAVRGASRLDGGAAFGGFEGRWYGRWDRSRVDHHWGPAIDLEPPRRVEIEAGPPVWIRSYQYAWIGDGYGINLIATSDLERADADYILGYVVHVADQNLDEVRARRPHVGIATGAGQLVWITAGEVFLEEAFRRESGADAYAITGFFYRDDGLATKIKSCFQAIYTRQPDDRPEFYHFDAEPELAVE